MSKIFTACGVSLSVTVKMCPSCICLAADAQTSSFMPHTWVDDNRGNFEVFCGFVVNPFFAWRTVGQEAFEMDPDLWE